MDGSETRSDAQVAGDLDRRLPPQRLRAAEVGWLPYASSLQVRRSRRRRHTPRSDTAPSLGHLEQHHHCAVHCPSAPHPQPGPPAAASASTTVPQCTANAIGVARRQAVEPAWAGAWAILRDELHWTLSASTGLGRLPPATLPSATPAVLPTEVEEDNEFRPRGRTHGDGGVGVGGGWAACDCLFESRTACPNRRAPSTAT